MHDLPGHDPAAGAVARMQLRRTQAECGSLYPLLPIADDWRGGAGRVFRLRVHGLRERIDAAVAALEAVEREL